MTISKQNDKEINIHHDDNENALAFFAMPTSARIDYIISSDAQIPGGSSVGSRDRPPTSMNIGG